MPDPQRLMATPPTAAARGSDQQDGGGRGHFRAAEGLEIFREDDGDSSEAGEDPHDPFRRQPFAQGEMGQDDRQERKGREEHGGEARGDPLLGPVEDSVRDREGQEGVGAQQPPFVTAAGQFHTEKGHQGEQCR
jgi:hypothetical protein